MPLERHPGTLAAPGKRRPQRTQSSAKRGPVALFTRKVPHVTGRNVPSASERCTGRGLFLVKTFAEFAGSHCWQAVPCASKPRRYCIQGVCIRRVPPSRSMDIDRVTRLARHTGFGQPALLRLAPFCSRYNAGTFRLFTKYQGRGEVRSGCHPVIEKTDTRM